MENKDSLEGRVWNSRIEYAVEAFKKVNIDYWKIWTELTNSRKMLSKLLGWADKAIWPLISVTAFPIIIPCYMTELKYSPESQGYILKDTQQASIR